MVKVGVKVRATWNIMYTLGVDRLHFHFHDTWGVDILMKCNREPKEQRHENRETGDNENHTGGALSLHQTQSS